MNVLRTGGVNMKVTKKTTRKGSFLSVVLGGCFVEKFCWYEYLSIGPVSVCNQT